jgi:hypothetical protein
LISEKRPRHNIRLTAHRHCGQYSDEEEEDDDDDTENAGDVEDNAEEAREVPETDVPEAVEDEATTDPKDTAEDVSEESSSDEDSDDNNSVASLASLTKRERGVASALQEQYMSEAEEACPDPDPRDTSLTKGRESRSRTKKQAAADLKDRAADEQGRHEEDDEAASFLMADEGTSAAHDLSLSEQEEDEDELEEDNSSVGHSSIKGSSAIFSDSELEEDLSSSKIYPTLQAARASAWSSDNEDVRAIRQEPWFTGLDRKLDMSRRISRTNDRISQLRDRDMNVLPDLSHLPKAWRGRVDGRTWKEKRFMLRFDPVRHRELGHGMYMSGITELHECVAFGRFGVAAAGCNRKKDTFLSFCPWCEHYSSSQTSLCSHVLGSHYYLGLLCHQCCKVAYTVSTASASHDAKCPVALQRMKRKAHRAGVAEGSQGSQEKSKGTEKVPKKKKKDVPKSKKNGEK